MTGVLYVWSNILSIDRTAKPHPVAIMQQQLNQSKSVSVASLPLCGFLDSFSSMVSIGLSSVVAQ
jgi:hypothetical protein